MSAINIYTWIGSVWAAWIEYNGNNGRQVVWRVVSDQISHVLLLDRSMPFQQGILRILSSFILGGGNQTIISLVSTHQYPPW